MIRIGTKQDINGILDLQRRNLYANLAQQELANGFVTTPFTPDLIEVLIDRGGVFVAESEGKIVGYLFAADWDFFSQWEIFRVMFDRLPELEFAGHKIEIDRTFQYGPVCIDAQLRGGNILPELFEEMRSSFAPRFSIGITFINQLNQRSFAAHTRKLKLAVVDEFDFNHHSFYTLAFPTTQRL